MSKIDHNLQRFSTCSQNLQNNHILEKNQKLNYSNVLHSSNRPVVIHHDKLFVYNFKPAFLPKDIERIFEQFGPLKFEWGNIDKNKVIIFYPDFKTAKQAFDQIKKNYGTRITINYYRETLKDVVNHYKCETSPSYNQNSPSVQQKETKYGNFKQNNKQVKSKCANPNCSSHTFNYCTQCKVNFCSKLCMLFGYQFHIYNCVSLPGHTSDNKSNSTYGATAHKNFQTLVNVSRGPVQHRRNRKKVVNLQNRPLETWIKKKQRQKGEKYKVCVDEVTVKGDSCMVMLHFEDEEATLTQLEARLNSEPDLERLSIGEENCVFCSEDTRLRAKITSFSPLQICYVDHGWKSYPTDIEFLRALPKIYRNFPNFSHQSNFVDGTSISFLKTCLDSKKSFEAIFRGLDGNGCYLFELSDALDIDNKREDCCEQTATLDSEKKRPANSTVSHSSIESTITPCLQFNNIKKSNEVPLKLEIQKIKESEKKNSVEIRQKLIDKSFPCDSQCSDELTTRHTIPEESQNYENKGSKTSCLNNSSSSPQNEHNKKSNNNENEQFRSSKLNKFSTDPRNKVAPTSNRSNFSLRDEEIKDYQERNNMLESTGPHFQMNKIIALATLENKIHPNNLKLFQKELLEHKAKDNKKSNSINANFFKFQLEIGKTEQVVITHRVNEETVFIASRSELKYILDFMNEFDYSTLPHLNAFKQGVKCSAPYEGKFYRAHIVSEDPLNVLFDDYGNVEEVEMKQLKQLPECLRDIPPRALKIKLTNNIGINDTDTCKITPIAWDIELESWIVSVDQTVRIQVELQFIDDLKDDYCWVYPVAHRCILQEIQALPDDPLSSELHVGSIYLCQLDGLKLRVKILTLKPLTGEWVECPYVTKNDFDFDASNLLSLSDKYKSCPPLIMKIKLKELPGKALYDAVTFDIVRDVDEKNWRVENVIQAEFCR